MSVRLLQVRSAKTSRNTTIALNPTQTFDYLLKQIASDFGIKSSHAVVGSCDVRVVDCDGNSESFA
jgi:hypothetical protein